MGDNRFCNLVSSHPIKEDFNNINIGFEKVQQEITSNTQKNDDIKNQIDILQQQINNTIIDGDSSPAIAQALSGTGFETLRQYLEYKEAQLAERIYYSEAQLIANTINKLIVGKNIIIAGLGDSIMDGYSANNNIGYMEKIKTAIETRYSVNVTLNNQGVSGYTVRDAFIFGKVSSVEHSNADLVIISFGHNDIKSDLPDYSPGQGYPIEQSISDTEHIVRRLRANNPSIDIIIMGESPYAIGLTTSNNYLARYTKEYKVLASKYNCLFLDMAPVFYSKIDWTPYMYDGGHPNEAGHQLIVDELMKRFLTISIQNNRDSVLPTTSIRKAWKYGKTAWRRITGTVIADGDRAMYNGVEWTGIPKTTSTIGNFVDILAKCHCVGIKMEITTGTRLLILRDSTVWYGDVTLGTIFPASPNTFWFTIPFDNEAGMHMARLYLRSGMLKIHEIWAMDSPFEFIKCDNPLITHDSNFALIDNTDSKGFIYNSKMLSPTIDSGYTITIPFIGTGLSGDFNIQNGIGILQVSVDGGVNVDISVAVTNAYNLGGGKVICSGLEYGQHTVTLVGKVGNTVRVRIGGFLVLDERRIEEPRIQRGLSKVGVIQSFGASFDAMPLVRVNGNSVYSTDVSKNGFKMVGVDGETGVWEAKGSRIAY